MNLRFLFQRRAGGGKPLYSTSSFLVNFRKKRKFTSSVKSMRGRRAFRPAVKADSRELLERPEEKMLV